MNKTIVFVLIAGLVLTSAVVFANSAGNSADQNASGQNTPVFSPPSMPLTMNLPKMKTVTATSDGGIVVMQGNKITKFDKDLNMVKTIDLNDTAANTENTGGQNNP